MWWRLYKFPVIDHFTFFHYLFFLAGPMCLYFGSLLLLPEPDDDDKVDMPAHFAVIRRKFFCFEIGFWVWAILLGPIVMGAWGEAVPFWVVMTAIAAALTFIRKPRVAMLLTLAACIVHVVFIFLVAMKLRGT
jgi:hypothetical protein